MFQIFEVRVFHYKSRVLQGSLVYERGVTSVFVLNSTSTPILFIRIRTPCKKSYPSVSMITCAHYFADL
jgi:hypothetical protein